MLKYVNATVVPLMLNLIYVSHATCSRMFSFADDIY